MTDPVLIVEDDESISRMLANYLEGCGYQTEVRETASAGLQCVERMPLSAVILDIMLPDLDGFEVCRRIRHGPHQSSVPVIMLTARGEDTDRIVGLEIGADDYLPKPFNPRELLARLRAVLRRHGAGTAGGDVLRFGTLEIDPPARSVRIDDRPVSITGYQFDLLYELARNAGRVMSRDHLHDSLRGECLGALDRRVDVQISRLRAAIEDDPKRPQRIVTVRGVGYVFAPQDGRSR